MIVKSIFLPIILVLLPVPLLKVRGITLHNSRAPHTTVNISFLLLLLRIFSRLRVGHPHKLAKIVDSVQHGIRALICASHHPIYSLLIDGKHPRHFLCDLHKAHGLRLAGLLMARITTYVVSEMGLSAWNENLVRKQVSTVCILGDLSIEIAVRGHHERNCETHRVFYLFTDPFQWILNRHRLLHRLMHAKPGSLGRLMLEHGKTSWLLNRYTLIKSLLRRTDDCIIWLKSAILG